MPLPLCILNFHGLGTPKHELPSKELAFWIRESQFDAILDYVRDRDGICLTFDDSNESDLTIALPALQARGMEAHFFLVAGRIGRPGYLSPAQVRALVSAGMAMGNHGMHHQAWAGLGRKDLD